MFKNTDYQRFKNPIPAPAAIFHVRRARKFIERKATEGCKLGHAKKPCSTARRTDIGCSGTGAASVLYYIFYFMIKII